MGIFSWGKYAKIIINAEKRFVRTWNYDLLPDEKTEDSYMVIAITALFVESELSGLEPDGFAKMVSGIRDSSPLSNVMGNLTTDANKALSVQFGHMYGFYLSSRRQGRSIVDSANDASDRIKSLGSF